MADAFIGAGLMAEGIIEGAGGKMTVVKVTETYDMKTSVGLMGLVGVHTPTVSLIQKLYPGLMKNHRFIRFVKCDVIGACASVLPADPLQVGVSAGEVAPEDMFNPILYSAVTNESFDSLVQRVAALSDVAALASVSEGLAIPGTQPASNHFKVYYSLLAENGKWRKAMPQSGFQIRNLVPLAHTIISTYGNVGGQSNDSALAEDGESSVAVPHMTVPTVTPSWQDGSTAAIYYRGRSVKMPKFPLHSGQEISSDIPTPNIPRTNVLAICLPPAKLHEFYYRMRVTWTISFEGVCSTLEAGSYGTLLSVGDAAHFTNYTFTSSKEQLSSPGEVLDVNNVELNKIMES